MNKEQIYDAQIFPLMAQICAIVQEHKIAMVASFAIPNDEDPDLLCTSCTTKKEFDPPESFKECVKILRPEGIAPLMLRTKHADGSETLTAIVG